MYAILMQLEFLRTLQAKRVELPPPSPPPFTFFLTLLLASPQSIQGSSNKISQSRFFLQFKESFELKILDMFIKGLIYPEQKVK